MICLVDAQAFIKAMPWPVGYSKPTLRIHICDGGFTAILYAGAKQNFVGISSEHYYTPEAAIANALEGWIMEHKLNAEPALFASIKRLSN
jgi:hypothetical protein